MAYLRRKDYDMYIQADNLRQVVNANDSLRVQVELAAQDEIISYLVQKYDVEAEFVTKSTFPYSYSTIYKGGNLVYLDYQVYVPGNTYTVNDLITYAGNCYICTGSTTGTFDPTKWQLLGVQYDLFFVTLPEVLFNWKTNYPRGSKVFWKDKTYTATRDLLGIFPDDPNLGLQAWGAGVSFSVPAGTLPTDSSVWTKGDNRNQQLVMHMIDVTLFHLHSRIAPNNIPQLRIDRYDSTIVWLKDVSRGDNVTAAIPRLQTQTNLKTGDRIRYGGNKKNINTY